MIGFYDYTVILTYISLMISIFGMTQAIHGHFKTAIFCLALSGLCDMFDGKIARTKRDRTEDEKAFGIQIDSLCDMVCFGALPALICYLLGVRGALGLFILFVYCICSIIRLAYFNVLEGKRQQTEGGANKYYHGLPITSIAVILPLIFLLQFFLPTIAFMVFLHMGLLVTGTLFVIDFPFRKPSNQMLTLLVAIVGIAVLVMVYRSRFRLPAMNEKTNPIVEEVLDNIGER